MSNVQPTSETGVSEADRRYSYNNDGQIVANTEGELDADHRFAHAANGKTPSQYRRDSNGEDGYDVRDLAYPASSSAWSMNPLAAGDLGNNDGWRTNWNNLASWAAQRYLDLMNDSSGLVSPAMKAALTLQATLSFTAGGPDMAHQNGQRMMQLVDEYRRDGAVDISTNRGGNNGPGVREAYNRAVEGFVSKLVEIEAKFPMQTPGAKEAKALTRQVWNEPGLSSGGPLHDAVSSFDHLRDAYGI